MLDLSHLWSILWDCTFWCPQQNQKGGKLGEWILESKCHYMTQSLNGVFSSCFICFSIHEGSWLLPYLWQIWRRKWQPIPVFLPGESQGQRSLVGCHLWDRTESNTAEVTQQQRQQHDKYFTDFIALNFYLSKKRIFFWSFYIIKCNQSVLEEINPEYSFEGLVLKLKLQYFGHLMRRANSLEKSLMLGKIEGRRSR